MDKDDLRQGDLIAFRIGSDPEFSAPNKEAWGLLKVLDLGLDTDQSFSVSVRAGLWEDMPTLWQAYRAPVLIEKRFQKLRSKGLTPQPVIFTTPFDCQIDLSDLVIIGREPWVRPKERAEWRKIRRDGHAHCLAKISHAPRSIDHEHRAIFDETQWKAEIAAYSERQKRLHQARAERENKRLRTLTLQALIEEGQFQDWDNRTHIVPPDFTKALRQRTKDLLAQTQSLGPKPKRKDLRALLKDYVSWINGFDGSYGYYIETEEREDLMGFVEELCWATKQKPLWQEVDAWRAW